MNLKIREFKVAIENYVNENELPPEIKRMVLKEIYDDAEKKAAEAIVAELKERDEAEQEEPNE